MEQLGRRSVKDDGARLAAAEPRLYLVRFHEVAAEVPVQAFLRERACRYSRLRWESVKLDAYELRPDCAATGRPPLPGGPN